MLTHLRSEFCSGQFDSRLLALAKPVALAADGRDVRVMQQPIEHRSCHGRIAGESRIPLRERQIARYDDRAMFVSLSNDLKEMAGLFAGERQIAELIDDQKLGCLDRSSYVFLEPTVSVS